MEKQTQSSTLKSYVSAIKSKLIADDYPWNDKLVLMNALTGKCRKKNDRYRPRLPIKRRLLHRLLNQISSFFSDQPYLKLLYKTMFCIAYYGMFRVGEITQSTHTIKAKNVHINRVKNKILIIMFTSKTHGRGHRPQRIKINSETNNNNSKYCPFQLLRNFLQQRGGYDNSQEPLFIHRGGTPVTSKQFSQVLRKMLKLMHMQHKLYASHSFRIGRASDLLREGHSIEYIKRCGRWKSNAVYKYLRD